MMARSLEPSISLVSGQFKRTLICSVERKRGSLLSCFGVLMGVTGLVET